LTALSPSAAVYTVFFALSYVMQHTTSSCTPAISLKISNAMLAAAVQPWAPYACDAICWFDWSV
jgi:hypothetical protein